MITKVQVQLKETSQPIEHAATNSYEKGGFFCVYEGQRVFKYPTSTIFRVVEDYGVHTSEPFVSDGV